MTELLKSLQTTAMKQADAKIAQSAIKANADVQEKLRLKKEAHDVILKERTEAYKEFRAELKQTAEMSGEFMTYMEYTGCQLRLNFTGNGKTNTLLVEYEPNSKIMVGELDGTNVMGIKRGLTPVAAMKRINEVVEYWDILVDGDAIDADIRTKAGL